jgi:hypothetical protein
MNKMTEKFHAPRRGIIFPATGGDRNSKFAQGCTKYSMITHPRMFKPGYAHLNKSFAAAGQKVLVGDLNNRVGATNFVRKRKEGCSRFSVHFKILRRGKGVDLLFFLA